MNQEIDYLKVLKILPEPIIITDTTPNIIYINPALEKMTGYKLSEIKGKNPRILKSGKTPLRVYRALYRALTSGKPFSTREVINKRKDGKFYQIDASYAPVCKGNKPVYFIQIQHDISEHKKVETKLAEEYVKRKALFESIGDGVIAMDKNGKIIAINKRTEAIFGWKTDDILGKSIFTEFKLADEQGRIVPKSLRPIQIAITTSKVGHGIYFLIKKGVEKIPMFITSAPVILYGKIVGAVNIYRDVSQQVAVDRAKDEFLYFASHTLRTPLSAIAWSLERLNANNTEFSDKQKKTLDLIYGQTQRMIQLTNDLLDATRMKFGMLSFKYNEVDLSNISSSVIDDLKNLITGKKIKLKLITGKNLIRYKTYPNALYIILHNLLSNAVKFTPPNGKIIINISKNKKELILQVTDSGIGISKSDQLNIFQKMYRSCDVKDKFAGSGLGLYITNGIVKHMDGKISVKSNKGKGATFVVKLPIVAKTE